MRFVYRRFGFLHEIITFDWGFLVAWSLGVRIFAWGDIHVEHDYSRLRGAHLIVHHGSGRYALPALDGLYMELFRGMHERTF